MKAEKLRFAPKPLGYTARFREWCHRNWELVLGQVPPVTAMFVAADALLEQAKIFQLPDRGRTLVANGLIEGSWGPLLKLPHPVTAFEFHCSGVFEWQSGAVVSRRRIALCADIEQARAARITPQLDSPELDGSWVQITVCSLNDGNRDLWSVPTVLNLVRADFVAPLSEDMIETSLSNARWRDSKGYRDADQSCEADTLRSIAEVKASGGTVIMPRSYSAAGHSEPGMGMLDTRDELIAAVHACVTLSCSNVQSVKVLPPADLNRTRQARGVPPLRSYHVLTVAGEPLDADLGAGAAAASHHFRRAHIRRLPNGDTTWVRHALVNAAKSSTGTP